MKVAHLSEVSVAPLPIDRFAEVETPERRRKVEDAIREGRRLFSGRVVWNVNSTAFGGGVAEMLRSLLAYARGAGIDARWLVIKGDPDFFHVTKRLHNHLHGAPGDGGSLGDAERAIYERTLAPNARELSEIVRPNDIVLLHDPQTAGLIPKLKQDGIHVVWRCHIGLDMPNDLARNAWKFLTPYVSQADAYVFSRATFAWEGLDPARTSVIPPSIDAFSPKNRELDEAAVRAILSASAVMPGNERADAKFLRQDGSEARIERRAEMFEDAPLPGDVPIVVQVSRWDRLKDPEGVIKGFAENVAPHCAAHLVLAGPAVEAVADDPEGAEVLKESIALWRALPDGARPKVHLACLPMVDGEENAAMVNALQRHAYVVVQKSLAEGFGLTVAEAMWKGRPVVASRIGGIQDQVEDGRTGLLLDDPRDLTAYGKAVVALILDEERAQKMGEAARHRVREHFLGDRHLLQYADLLQRLL